MTHFFRPPSVAEYAAMSEAARLAAAEDLADFIDTLNARTPRPGVRLAEDWEPEETLEAARAMLPMVAHRWPDPPHVQLRRQQELLDAKDTRASVRGAVA